MTSLEIYLRELREARAVAVNETSYYGALANLFNDIGKTLKPKVRYVSTPQGLDAGLPDGGLYTTQQLRGGDEASPATTPPERGAVEAKGLGEDVEKVAARRQVQKYLERYGLVLVTNYRDFLLLGQDRDGKRVRLERYTLSASEADFWAAAAHPRQMAADHSDLLTEYLKRVMLHAAPLSTPEDVARFLASYARDARARVERKPDLPALQGLRAALEEALGLEFEGEKGEHFFRSTLVQTLFYGIFSAWVLWSQQQATAESRQPFEWRTAAWYLRVPMISALFQQLLMPAQLQPLGLVEVLDWAAMTLNRIEDPTAFIQKFTEGHAVQYFYEPFLQEFDPELRKQLGVWYTPPEIVKYMVARVDTVLREELNVPEGLASEDVYVLDPCCGTGTYLVEVLRRIEATLKERGEDATTGAQLKEAAIGRVFGFEILPAPFVVAHLQLGLLLQTLDAPLAGEERVGVYLTNALTGWELRDRRLLNWPELESEREGSGRVKREEPILVVLGNPPYNAFAGVSPTEEEGLVEVYKGMYYVTKGTKRNVKGVILPDRVKRFRLSDPESKGGWGIKKYNLDDLYVRFFRIAERRIAEKTGRGVVSFISNYSWTSEPSFVVMREHLLKSFDKVWIENMHGNRNISEYAPDGRTSETIFAIQGFSPGIKQGIAISLLVKRGHQKGVAKRILFRNDLNAAKAVERRAQLLESLKVEAFDTQYEQSFPTKSNRLSFRPSDVAAHYQQWPRLIDLCAEPPINGLMEKRGGALIDIDQAALENRMRMFYDPTVDWETLKALDTGLTKNAAGFEPRKVRAKIQAAESYQGERLLRYAVRPFDTRWCYYSGVSPLWNRSRPTLRAQSWEGNEFLMSRPAGVASPEGSPLFFTTSLGDNDFQRGHSYYFPVRLRTVPLRKADEAQNHFFAHAEAAGDAPTANLSSSARTYLASLGIEEVDADADTAALVWMHALAIGYSPVYLAENADGIRDDWPRVPLPADVDALHRSAELGRQVAAILAYDAGDTSAPPSPLLRGIIMTPLRPEMRVIGNVLRVGGGQLRTGEGELGVTANWGSARQKNMTMPGKGRSVEHVYTEDERAAIEQGAGVLGISADEVFKRLGETTIDVYLNEAAYWKNVPLRVWEYHIGGYQVIKKWLSYRERDLLGRDLMLAEVGEVRDMARRIAALCLLEPALDANYLELKESAYV